MVFSSDYLLKPVDEKRLEKSLAKIDLLKKSVSKQYDSILLTNCYAN